MVVATIIAINAVGLFRDNLSFLLGRSPGPEFLARVEEVARSVEGVLDVRELRAEYVSDPMLFTQAYTWCCLRIYRSRRLTASLLGCMRKPMGTTALSRSIRQPPHEQDLPSIRAPKFIRRWQSGNARSIRMDRPNLHALIQLEGEYDEV